MAQQLKPIFEIGKMVSGKKKLSTFLLLSIRTNLLKYLFLTMRQTTPKHFWMRFVRLQVQSL